MNAVIKAEALTVRRGDTVALDTLGLSAPAGSVTAILGPNGAGKTTLTRTIASLQPYQGSVKIDGIEVSSAPNAVRDRVGIAGQHTTLPDQHTSSEYLRVIARLRGLSRRDAHRAVDTSISEHDLGAFALRRLSRCSGGQRRRVALAASLVGDPRIIVLDEPTTGLDPHSRARIWEHVDRLRFDGVSVLLTTQDLAEATRLAERIIILDRGRCLTAGPLRELRTAQDIRRLTLELHDGHHERHIHSLSEGLATEGHTDTAGYTFVGDFDATVVNSALAGSGILPHLAEMHLEPPTLEDIYRTVVDSRDGQPT